MALARLPGFEEANLQDFLIARELAEVYLLLDNISATTGKDMPSETLDKEPLFAKNADKSWVEQICDITWPPDEKTLLNESEDAAKLIRAKDALNAQAWPATGTSIAFTLMMSGEAREPRTGVSRWQRLLMWAGGFEFARAANADPATTPVVQAETQVPEEESEAVSASPKSGPVRVRNPVPTRASLAAMAYPTLARQAWRWRLAIQGMMLFMVAWLVITSWLSWDIARGSSLLNRVNELSAIVSSANTPVPSPTNSPTASPTPGSGAAQAPAPAANNTLCAQQSPAAGTTVPQTGNGSARQNPPVTGATPPGADTGAKPDPKNQMRWEQATDNLDHWLNQANGPRLWFRELLGGSGAQRGLGAGVSSADSVKDKFSKPGSVNVEWATVYIGVIAGTVLPMFYGLLGAGATVVRSVSAKMRDSVLTPRDIVLAYVQLALGAVIGACVGLFVTSDGNASTATGGLLGPVHLSASALCFIAGFGVEGVFQALEELVKRVFNLEKPEPGK
jgi:hypothetical protein